ncbi:hypothetical protein ACH5RR_039870 [Cinchona calisaya]|uniref:Uncharacterized protein n=1 Tax=Cinchona calisaya TaxID=153742 RepID=A0ABD2Y4I7_9GENT
MRKLKLEAMRKKYANLTQVERQQYIQFVSENRKKRKFPQITNNEENTDKSPRSTQCKKSKYARLTNEQRRRYIENVKNLRKQALTGQRRNRGQSKNKWLLKAQMTASDIEVDDEFYDSELYELKKIQNCTHCNAIKFDYEPPTFCCDNGKIKLALVEIPQELLEFFTSTAEESEIFLESIRAYNEILVGTKIFTKLIRQNIALQ